MYFFLFLGNGWYSAAAEASCTDGCSDQGLVCNESALLAHNDEVNSSEKVFNVIAQVRFQFPSEYTWLPLKQIILLLPCILMKSSTKTIQ